jgi:hypothetical protein
MVHEGLSRARGRLEVRQLRNDGHGLALAGGGQALRLRRPRKLRLALPLCTEVRGETVWKIAEGLSAVLHRRQEVADRGPIGPF